MEKYCLRSKVKENIILPYVRLNKSLICGIRNHNTALVNPKVMQTHISPGESSTQKQGNKYFPDWSALVE